MKHFIIILLSALIGLISCSGTSTKHQQYKLGVYVFTQTGILPYQYSCSVDNRSEADELFKMFFDDHWEHKDYKDRKFFKKYGLIIEPWDIVYPFEKYKSGKYIYEDYTKSHVEFWIFTPEEYEQREREFQQLEQEKNNRLKSLE